MINYLYYLRHFPSSLRPRYRPSSGWAKHRAYCSSLSTAICHFQVLDHTVVMKNMKNVKIGYILSTKKPDLKSVGLLPPVFKLTQALADLLYFLTFLVFVCVPPRKKKKNNTLHFWEKAYPKHLKIAFLIIVYIVFKLCKLEHYSHFTSCV